MGGIVKEKQTNNQNQNTIFIFFKTINGTRTKCASGIRRVKKEREKSQTGEIFFSN